MAIDSSLTQRSQTQNTLGDLLEDLVQYSGPPEQFLAHLLALQCQVVPADAGAFLRLNKNGHVEVLAIHPAPPKDAVMPAWLTQGAQQTQAVVDNNEAAIVPIGQGEFYGQAAREHLVLAPLRGIAGLRGSAAFVVRGNEPVRLDAARQRLELTVCLLSLYEMRLTLQRRSSDLSQLKQAMETLTSVSGHSRFKATAIAMCNDIAARWAAERVSVGFLRGRYVKLQAISHTEKFSRKMKLVQDVESVMEEALDQDLEVMYPAAPESVYINRQAKDASTQHNLAVLSLPLRRDGKPVAVVTVERPIDNPFSAEEVSVLRLACDLCTPWITELHETDRWVGARLAMKSRRGAAALLGPKHTWAKLTVVGVLAAVLFLVFAKGEDRVEASFVLKPVQRQVLAAPFDGRLSAVNKDPDDTVAQGDVIAELDDSDLKLQLFEAIVERNGYRTQADVAMAENKPGEQVLAQLKAEQIEPRIARLEYEIEHAKIRSPIDGRVILGDLKKNIGMPVTRGDVLFEVAPIDWLRAELRVPEHRVADVIGALGDRTEADDNLGGHLATAADPSDYLRFEVERVNPVAEVVGQSNVFIVRAKLVDQRQRMRPGMEGIAKVNVGRKSLAYIWTRDLINWVRMKLWV